jgi:hypothetical protein
LTFETDRFEELSTTKTGLRALDEGWHSYTDDPVQIAMHKRIFDEDGEDVEEEARILYEP